MMICGYTLLFTPPVRPVETRMVARFMIGFIAWKKGSSSIFQAKPVDQVRLNCSLLPKLLEPSERKVAFQTYLLL